MSSIYESTESIVNRIVNRGVMKSIDEAIMKKETAKCVTNCRQSDASEVLGWRTERRYMEVESTSCGLTKKKGGFEFRDVRDYTKTQKPVKFDRIKHEIVAVMELTTKCNYKVFEYDQTSDKPGNSESNVMISEGEDKVISNKADIKVEVIQPTMDKPYSCVNHFRLEEASEPKSRHENIDFSKLHLEPSEFSTIPLLSTNRPQRNAVRRQDLDDPGKLNNDMIKTLLLSQECAYDINNDTEVIYKTDTDRLMATYDYGTASQYEGVPRDDKDCDSHSGFIQVSSRSSRNVDVEGDLVCGVAGGSYSQEGIGEELEDELLRINITESFKVQPVIIGRAAVVRINERYAIDDDENLRIENSEVRNEIRDSLSCCEITNHEETMN